MGKQYRVSVVIEEFDKDSCDSVAVEDCEVSCHEQKQDAMDFSNAIIEYAGMRDA
jgi:hypothetical protein